TLIIGENYDGLKNLLVIERERERERGERARWTCSSIRVL
ncbi:type III restriction endonuclease subunit M, partial [Mycoplasma flocculare]|nr:type III restriction endonuclease subunit M [Mesomycoplasma flocculare]